MCCGGAACRHHGGQEDARADPALPSAALSSVDVQLSIDTKRRAIDIEATCKLKGRTGVEMEALTAASVAALTVYDMCKSVDRAW